MVNFRLTLLPGGYSMLSLLEKIIFVILASGSLAAAYFAIHRIVKI